MKISVVVPTYCPKNYLWECLSSLSSQTLSGREFEVIIVLNGCKEPYMSQIRDYIDNYMANHIVRLVQTDIPGVSNARNIGLDIACGEYITFVDDDDYISPEYLSELLTLASYDTIPLCFPQAFKDGTDSYYDYYITKEYNKRAHKGKQSFVRARSFFSGPVYKLIHRSIIEDMRFDKEFSNGEDSIFMFEISKNFKYVTFTSPSAVYYRRVRSNSATTSLRHRNTVIRNRLAMINKYSRLYFSHPLHYNIWFFITRVGAALKVIVNKI